MVINTNYNNNLITITHLIFWVVLEHETWKNDRFRITDAYVAVTQIDFAASKAGFHVYGQNFISTFFVRKIMSSKAMVKLVFVIVIVLCTLHGIC